MHTCPNACSANITYIREPHRPVNTDVLSKSDIRVFREMIKAHGDKDFGALMDMTHEHAAYKNAWLSRGPRNRAPMSYEDMIEDENRRAEMFEEGAQSEARFG